jgi:endonuclease/exonuclease/phosphatase family metal-dependent hydrolase
MRDICLGNFARPRWTSWPRDTIRVVDWNIDRGLRLQEIIEFLDAQSADVLILQEVDLNARRSGYRNIAEEIARQLRMNYVFGCEFQEPARLTGISWPGDIIALAAPGPSSNSFPSSVQLLETEVVLATHGAVSATAGGTDRACYRSYVVRSPSRDI